MQGQQHQPWMTRQHPTDPRGQPEPRKRQALGPAPRWKATALCAAKTGLCMQGREGCGWRGGRRAAYECYGVGGEVLGVRQGK